MDKILDAVRRAIRKPEGAALIGIFLLVITLFSAVVSIVSFLKKPGLFLTCVLPLLIFVVAGVGILKCVRRTIAPEEYPHDDSENFRLEVEKQSSKNN